MYKQTNISMNFKNVLFRVAVVMTLLLLLAEPIEGKKKTTKTTKKTTTQTAMTGFAARWYNKAKAGDAEAQAWLAESYCWGMGVKENDQKAMEWSKKASNQGNPLATWRIGNMYESGDGVVENKTLAQQWYNKAHEQASLGVQSNDAMSQLVMGLLYDYGDGGVIENASEAASWYLKSAEQGNVLAQNSIGFCYYKGIGVAQDYSKAIEWYRKAADQEYARSQFELAQMYYNGEVVSQDYYEAFKWYKKAAEQGYIDAYFYVGVCYSFGEGVANDYVEAFKWYKKAAEYNDETAQWNLYCYYRDGKGVAKNMKIAYEWLQKAADNGYEDAIKELEYIKRQQMPMNELTALKKQIGLSTYNTLQGGYITKGMRLSSIQAYRDYLLRWNYVYGAQIIDKLPNEVTCSGLTFTVYSSNAYSTTYAFLFSNRRGGDMSGGYFNVQNGIVQWVNMEHR